MTVPQPVNVSAIADIAAPICRQWQAAADAIIHVGTLLAEAKAMLPHGAFDAMVKNELPFGARTARMLMAVARNDWLANRNHGSVLPPSWRTLYELSRLPTEELDRAFSEGLIRPDMERSDVVAIRHGQLPAVILPADTAVAVDGYRAIIADPPWEFKTRSELGQEKSPSRHYKTMTVEEIADLPVGDLATPDAVLVLWTTFPRLFDARAVIEAWGFRYVTGGPWYKRSKTNRKWSFGTGYVLRNAAEVFLIAFRGRPKVNGSGIRGLLDEDPGIEAPLREHSRKPDAIYGLVEKLVPVGPYVELFARQAPPGWDVWGNEIDKFEYAGGGS